MKREPDLAILQAVPDTGLEQLFLHARKVHAFKPVPVADETIRALFHDLLRWGPTAFNAPPAHYVFVRSTQAKARLRPALTGGDTAQTLAAGVTVIVAHDTKFYEHQPDPFDGHDGRSIFKNHEEAARAMAFRNSSLQGAYLVLAARALGLDAGPQSGFDAALVDKAFFPDGRYRANFLVNLGVADRAGNFARGPRLAFDDLAEIV
ncbi:malonic semialdehyde reductase [Polaromonas sp.]|uniref:malonic semialdehyde reductase n=1 Tax=Polaromonas sp. TaxID=1869339 RepID=UPI003BA8B7C4